MKPVKPVVVLVIALVVGIAAGYGGYYYRGTQIPTRGNFAGRGNAAQLAGGRGMMNGGRVSGQILSADSTSITVKLADGSSKIVLLSDQTTINKATQGSKTDLTSGTTVSVFGPTNSDGSVTAQNIQINPASPTPAPTK
jgi:hypothetical protein